MQIKKVQENHFEIKTKEATILLNNGVKIGDVQIKAPGEYEVGGVFVCGIASDEQTIYTIASEGLNVCYLGELKKSLNAESLDQLDDVDLLFLPAGGQGSLELKQALSLLQKIDPKIVIPIYVADEGEFLKSEGTASPRREKILKIQKNQLPEEEREIIILE